jgi:hypothetical protein
MTTDPAFDFPRLAELARKRRAELGLALTDHNAKRGDISKHTWQRVEKAMPIRQTNYVKIDRMLLWGPGSCIRVLEGGDPWLPRNDAEVRGAQNAPAAQEDVEGRARDVVQLAIIATAKGTTAEQIREISDRVVQDLRERGII